MKFYEMNDQKYQIVGIGRIVDTEGNSTGDTIPMIEMSSSSDYYWFLSSLDSRLKKPELYRNEDIEKEKQKIKQFLLEQTTYELYKRYFDKYKDCYDFIYNDAMEAVAV